MDLALNWFVFLSSILSVVLVIQVKASPLFKTATIITLIHLALDAGIAPIATFIYDFPTSDPTILFGGRAEQSELGLATFGLTLHYSFIVLGVFFGFLNSTQFKKKGSSLFTLSFSPSLLKGSMCCLFFGLGSQLLVLRLLMKNNSLFEIASTRAFFSDETVVFDPIFNYLLFFSPLLEVGTFGALIFAGRRGGGVWLFGAVPSVFFNIIYGGRTRTIISIIMFAIAYHFSRRRLNFVKLLLILGLVVIGLGIISLIRFGAANLTSGLASTAEVFLFARRIEQMAFSIRTFPDDEPYFNGTTLTPGLGPAMPGLKLPGENPYMYFMTQRFGEGFTEKGKGGGNYAAAAEHYMNFGWAGVMAIALAYGFFFGRIFSWGRGMGPDGLSLLLFCSSLPVFLGGLDARSVPMFSNFFPRTLFPVGLLLLFAHPHTKTSYYGFVSLGAIALSFLVSRLSDPLGRPLLVLSFCIFYYIIFRLLRFSSRIKGGHS